MTETIAAQLAAVAALPERIGSDLEKLGGFLECQACGSQRGFRGGDRGSYLAHGWPRCCGYTMRWWTARQEAAGEAPARRV